ncbi:MAG TPA: hypothetical protein VH877_01785 [Polyangia bacterium]|jgi:hypothetical protein|nr:hypothetical protein [Polyangia bacterium]
MSPQRSTSLPISRLLIGAGILVALVTGVITTCSAADVPLTTERLRAIVRDEGISKADGVQFNRDAGRALQDAVLRSHGWEENKTKFPTKERSDLTDKSKNRAESVIPDAVDGVRETTSDPDLGNGTPLVRTYQNSTFIEVKATRKGLRCHRATIRSPVSSMSPHAHPPARPRTSYQPSSSSPPPTRRSRRRCWTARPGDECRSGR